MAKPLIFRPKYNLISMSINNAPSNTPMKAKESKKKQDHFEYEVDRFADVRVIRYTIPDWEKLSLKQKTLVYYLSQAGYSGRDIIWDQNYRHNLVIREILEGIYKNFTGNRSGEEWKQFLIYLKRVWFSNGIHHHYSNDKFIPEFSKGYFFLLLETCSLTISNELIEVIFNPHIDAKKVSLDPEKDLLLASCVNFYEAGITEKEALDFYSKMSADKEDRPVSYGLNSKLVRLPNGHLGEVKWTENGMYGSAIKEIIFNLEKACQYSENKAQKEALELLIKYYKTGDLKVWDEYNIAWTNATEGDIDYINSFIEVYSDPLGSKGAYESIVQIRDFEASERMSAISEKIQWFEDHSPIKEEYKKKNVKGVSYKVVNVASESGDSSPAGPIGVNLPNANWIRAEHGSKSVSLGNISDAYKKSSNDDIINEFAYDKEEIKRYKEHAFTASHMHTALHEVVGHASGQLKPGVGTPKETLKNYASTLEEARADLVALYFIFDPELIKMGLINSLEVGKTEYDGYIRNGLLVQLRRIELGNIIEESHMRNRMLVASWAFEKGRGENVIERIVRDGKSYYKIHDYEKLRALFAELLIIIQNIKSEGDYETGRKLVEEYAVKVDVSCHKEVIERVAKLNIPPYNGFVNPELIAELDTDKNIKEVKVEYPTDFVQQMLSYSERYGFLRIEKK
jgi:dipeptidyl-peptidase-3